jgi:hypothetical protein
MDPQTQKLIRRLQSGPYDATALDRIREELAMQREQLATSNDRETLRDVAALLDTWAQSARDNAVASVAYFEAGSIYEIELNAFEIAAQRYASSLSLNAANMETFRRLVPMLRKREAYDRLEAIIGEQARVLATADTVDPAIRLEVLREIAKMSADKTGNLDNAIQSYEDIVNLEPDLSDVIELARLRSNRGQSGDIERAADLYYTAGDVTGEPDGIEMVSKALDLNPSHADALALLERWIPQKEQAPKLRYRWAAFLEKAQPGPASDARRRALALAYETTGEYQKGLDCIAPLLKQGDAEAKEIHIKLRARLDLANKAPQPPSPAQPETVEKSSDKRSFKKTMLGYKVDATTPQPAKPLVATRQPISQTEREPLETSRTLLAPLDQFVPKPPRVAAAPIPSAPVIRQAPPPLSTQTHASVDSSEQPPLPLQFPTTTNKSPSLDSIPPDVTLLSKVVRRLRSSRIM